jgi:hypothetical protein
MSGDVTYTLPAADGSSGTILSTNGAGTLSWTGTLSALTITTLTSDTIILDDQGELRLREATGGGTNYTGFKAPAALAGNVIYTMPTADGAASTFLQTDGGGNLSWATSTATLQVAYDNAEDITCGAATSTWSQANNNTILSLVKTGVGAGYPLSITNDGSAYGAYISQTASNYGVYILAASSAGGLSIHNDGSAYGVRLQQDGNQTGLYIEQNANQNAIDINKVAVGAGTGMSIVNAGTGSGLYIDQNGNGYALNISQAAVASNAVNIVNAGTGYGVYVDQNGLAAGVYVDQAANANAVHIVNGGTASSLYIDNNDGHGIILDHTGTDEAITVINAGTGSGMLIDQDGDAVALTLNVAAASSNNVIDITNAGSGLDIDGAGSTWSVRKGGGATFTGFITTPADKTIDGAGAIAVDADDYYIEIIPNGGVGSANDNLDTITGGTKGQHLLLQAKTTSAGGNDQITVRDAIGNINTKGSANYVMDHIDDNLLIYYNGSAWVSIPTLASVS